MINHFPYQSHVFHVPSAFFLPVSKFGGVASSSDREATDGVC
ncbi:hypothetical protein HanXRQr2_Chr16g0740651 [Helianthus annuus]|uniref:Uncharacterized protein n=1 Tax=Helianthus annuus TaxID=4232 RepID=A0A9K3GY41_HELAN|nr:hypothetical protein HanXRQr2_Chr16g0740651 [Helianthus annuus]